MLFKKPNSNSGTEQNSDNRQPKPAGKVTIASGAHPETSFPVAGKTVAWVLERLGKEWNIDPDSSILVNGRGQDKNYVLQENDQLEFVKTAGQKG